MIFANSYEEQLSLSLFKPLLMFCKADCVCQWEGLNHSPSSSAGVWMHLKQAEECQGLTFHNHKKHTQFMEMKNMKLRTSRNLPNHSVLLLSVRLDDSTPNISIIWASIILLTVTVTVSNKMWSFPFNIAQTYKPAISAWGCNLFKLKYWLYPNT